MKSPKKQSDLDQYYTKPEIAEECLLVLNEVLQEVSESKRSFFLEPSAGTGVFVEKAKSILHVNKIIAFDIEPKHPIVKQQDFLKFNGRDWNNVITIGNPPFGKKSNLAIEFFNKAAEFSSIIAFIVPVQFQKWSVQKNLNENFNLIVDKLLPEDAFTFDGKAFKARCCFQIWANFIPTGYSNLRILTKPCISHPDFEMYQYNNTKEAKKYFDYDWDFCIPRQGYYDYKTKIYQKSDCKSNVQYIFFKLKNEKAKEIFEIFDFEKLALKNTTIPGFGKADVVFEYERIEKRVKEIE